MSDSDKHNLEAILQRINDRKKELYLVFTTHNIWTRKFSLQDFFIRDQEINRLYEQVNEITL